jgi:hypothetical protein
VVTRCKSVAAEADQAQIVKFTDDWHIEPSYSATEREKNAGQVMVSCPAKSCP